MTAVGGALRSAYADRNGAEPQFTNLASTARDPSSESFCETLDYIFLGDAADAGGAPAGRWVARAVKPLTPKAEALANHASYPSATEPSDHVAIWADLDLE